MAVKMQLSETIAAPPERVYAVLSDLDQASQWMQGLISLEKLTQGSFGVGTSWRETRKLMGHRASEVFEVASAEPGSRIALFCDGKNGTSRSGHYRFTYRLSPYGGGTRLELDGEITQLGWFGELLSSLFSGTYKKLIARDLTALKKHLESSAA